MNQYLSNPDAETNQYPSSAVMISDQIIYRLAALEATMKGSITLLDNKLDRLQKDLADSRAESIKEIGTLEGRVNSLEKWQDRIMTRVATISVLVFGAWALFGDYVKHLLGIN